MSEDISLDLEATESVERRQRNCFKSTTKENSSKTNENRATVKQVIDEMMSYKQWNLGTFILTFILSILGGWDPYHSAHFHSWDQVLQIQIGYGLRQVQHCVVLCLIVFSTNISDFKGNIHPVT